MKEYSVHSRLCPSHNVLEGISNKWCILILTLLSQKIYRFGELKRELAGISPKMLTQVLQKLEKYGFVKRELFPETVVRVEYSLSPLGHELSVILSSLTEWTEGRMKEILAAEEDFAGRHAEISCP